MSFFDVGAVVASLEAQNEKLRAEVAELKLRIRRAMAIVRANHREPTGALVDSIEEELTGKPKNFPTLADLRRPLGKRLRGPFRRTKRETKR